MNIEKHKVQFTRQAALIEAVARVLRDYEPGATINDVDVVVAAVADLKIALTPEEERRVLAACQWVLERTGMGPLNDFDYAEMELELMSEMERSIMCMSYIADVGTEL